MHAVFATDIPAISATPPVSAGIPTASWQDRKLIAESHLFQSAGEDASGGINEPPEQNLPETNLPLKLLGTVVNSDQKASMAAIRITDQNESVVVRQGEKVHGEAKVYRIERRRVVIINGRKTETLTLDEEPSTTTTSASARKMRGNLPGRPDRSSRRRARTSSPQDMPSDVQKAMIDSMRRDPASVLGMADLRPQFDEKGGVSGIRIDSVQAGSLIEQIGLKEGDVIKELNGITINNPSQSITLLREFQNATNLNVVVETADGKKNTLTYEGTP